MTRPVNAADIPWQEYRHSEKIRLRYKAFETARDAHMGVCIQELPAGCTTEPAHYHLREEEHLFVLQGTMTLRLAQERITLRTGDYMRFAAGDDREHCLINDGDAACEFLLWGERNPDDVVIYPDSNKVSVASLREIYRRQPVDYWDGEDA